MSQTDFPWLPPRTEIDLFLLSQVLDGRDGILLHREEAARLFRAKAADHRFIGKLCTADTAETAIAPGSAPAGLSGLEHPHREMVVPLQMQGGRQTGVASADNRY